MTRSGAKRVKEAMRLFVQATMDETSILAFQITFIRSFIERNYFVSNTCFQFIVLHCTNFTNLLRIIFRGVPNNPCEIHESVIKG